MSYPLKLLSNFTNLTSKAGLISIYINPELDRIIISYRYITSISDLNSKTLKLSTIQIRKEKILTFFTVLPYCKSIL